MPNPAPPRPSEAISGIRQNNSGQSYIPGSLRPDGTRRKEIKVRAGYTPPEDVETYKNRSAYAFASRNRGIPGAEPVESATNGVKNKNAKRRANKTKDEADIEDSAEAEIASAMMVHNISEADKVAAWRDPEKLITNDMTPDHEAEKQKKIRKPCEEAQSRERIEIEKGQW